VNIRKSFVAYSLFLFFEAKPLGFEDIPVPLSVQMLLYRTKANASGSITTTIGATLEASLLRWNFSKRNAHHLKPR